MRIIAAFFFLSLPVIATAHTHVSGLHYLNNTTEVNVIVSPLGLGPIEVAPGEVGQWDWLSMVPFYNVEIITSDSMIVCELIPNTLNKTDVLSRVNKQYTLIDSTGKKYTCKNL